MLKWSVEHNGHIDFRKWFHFTVINTLWCLKEQQRYRCAAYLFEFICIGLCCMYTVLLSDLYRCNTWTRANAGNKIIADQKCTKNKTVKQTSANLIRLKNVLEAWTRSHGDVALAVVPWLNSLLKCCACTNTVITTDYRVLKLHTEVCVRKTSF